jgi:hypothetical protein
MIYSLVVEGLIFTQTDVFGKYLPSRSSIEDIMSRLENINRTDDENRENKQRFCSLNYIAVVELDKSFNPLRYLSELENKNIVQNYQEWLMHIEIRIDKPSFLELSVMYQRNLDRMCQLTGNDFNCVIQDNFVIAWYGYLLGNSGHIGVQKIRKELTTLLKVAEGRKALNNYKPIEKQDDYLFRLRDHKNLGLADKSFASFTDTVSSLAESNDEMFVLNMAQHQVMLRLAEIAEKLPNRSVPFLCRFCNNISGIIRGGKTPASCGKCKNKYSASTSAKNRQTPSAINRKGNCLSLPKANSGKSTICDSCGHRKVCYILEKENFCKDCLRKHVSW